MRQKGNKANEKTIIFLKNVPIYPKTVSPRSLGVENWNLPTDSLLLEDDDGYVSFMTENDKQRTISNYLEKSNL